VKTSAQWFEPIRVDHTVSGDGERTILSIILGEGAILPMDDAQGELHTVCAGDTTSSCGLDLDSLHPSPTRGSATNKVGDPGFCMDCWLHVQNMLVKHVVDPYIRDHPDLPEVVEQLVISLALPGQANELHLRFYHRAEPSHGFSARV